MTDKTDRGYAHGFQPDWASVALEVCGCEEAKRLRSELETAQQRLAEGIEVMNARQANDRAEIERLKEELRRCASG